MSQSLPPIGRNVTRCLVCGFSEVRTDAVMDRGLLVLHECPHCTHRWTVCAEQPRPVVLARRRPWRVSAAA